MKQYAWIFIATTALMLAIAPARAADVGTAFTYQGQLKEAGVPLDGTADFQFTLWDAAGSGIPPTGGTQVGGVQAIIALPVTAGLFNVTLNGAGEFGASAFNGDARWLQIAVRSPAGSGAFTTLSPRQVITATPYALALPGMRTIPSAAGASVIGGSTSNTIGAGVAAAIIGGGDSNTVTSSGGAITGGESNAVNAPKGAIGGGANNIVGGSFAFVGGGQDNIANGLASAVLGGQNNIAGGVLSSIPGGDQNQAGGSFSIAAGRRAKVRDATQVGGGDTDGDQGAFVFADSLNSDFTTTGPNQFLVRATGGVGINTNAPQATLHVLGSAKLEGTAGSLLELSSGAGFFGSAGGNATLASGNGSSPVNGNGSQGGDVAVTGGNGAPPAGLGSLGGRGGDVNISGGTGSNANRGGNIALMPGAGGSGGAAGMVGIGTATPTAKLDIVGVAGTDGIRFPDGSLQTKAFDGHSLDAADGSPVNAVFVAASGNVGVNTTSPTSRLHVIGDVEISGSRLHVASNGDVGIGTNGPQAKLHVTGVVRADGGVRFPDGNTQVRAADVLRGSFTFDPTSILAGATGTFTVGPVAGMDTTSVVHISPDLNWPDGLVIAFCRSADASHFQIKVANITGVAIDAPSTVFQFAVFP